MRRIVSQLRDSYGRPREAEVEERDAEMGSRMSDIRLSEGDSTPNASSISR